MRIGDKHYTRAEVLERIGNVAQLGGTRHYTLSDGRSKGVAAVDVDTGSDSDCFAYVAMINPELHGGLGLYVKFYITTLPYLNEWKMMGQGNYLVGIEPCNAPCENRAALREAGLLPFLEPVEIREMNIEIGVLEGQAEITELVKRIESTTGAVS